MTRAREEGAGEIPKVSGSAGAKSCRQWAETVVVEMGRKRWSGEKWPRRFACVSSGARSAGGGRRQRCHLRRARWNTKRRQRRNRVAGLSPARKDKLGLFPRWAAHVARLGAAIGQLPCNRVRRPALCSKKPPGCFEPRRILNRPLRETTGPLLCSRGAFPSLGSKASPDCTGRQDSRVARKPDTIRTPCSCSSVHPGHVRISSQGGIPRWHYPARRTHGAT